ncbi:MAG: acyl-CoA thioesterase [Eggerthellaceae bacterium]|nr:acyl-CoA thioesterase [Eggerthellaceae bacterium]
MHVDTPIKVRYGETDMMGVVYHANYLLYFEDARLDFLEALDFSYAEEIEAAGYMSPIHDLEVHYHAPLRYGEAGFVRTSIEKSQPMKTVYHQRVFRASDDPAVDKPLVDARLTLCVVERDTFKPVNLKRTFPELYAKYAEAVEDSAW